jgi:hypothetical protein
LFPSTETMYLVICYEIQAWRRFLHLIFVLSMSLSPPGPVYGVFSILLGAFTTSFQNFAYWLHYVCLSVTTYESRSKYLWKCIFYIWFDKICQYISICVKIGQKWRERRLNTALHFVAVILTCRRYHTPSDITVVARKGERSRFYCLRVISNFFYTSLYHLLNS